MNALPLRAEPAMSDADFRTIQSILRQTTGIALADGKRPLVVSRLTRRLRTLKLRDFSQYSALITRPEGEAELGMMISALTTNVTAFFREGHHFDTLRDRVLPPLIAEARKGGRVRLWSAACSSGEEAYSLAMTLLDLCPEAERLNIRILATDIDPSILETAHAGQYSAEAVGSIPPSFRERWLAPVAGSQGQKFQIGPELSRLITFNRLNLTGAWPLKCRFDVIFCRNVAIYFDREVQERLWARLADQLVPGGTLCIGHSERIIGPAAQTLRQQGITTYVRHPQHGEV